MKIFLVVPVLLLLLTACKETLNNPSSKVELSKHWEFKQANKGDWHPATVPGTVHTDLFENNLIGDPYWENNEILQQWIEEENWIYRNEFEVSASQLNQQHIELVFEGLDTYASVYLNDTLLLQSNNMFRTWKIDILPYLNIGKNHLQVHFQSPLNKHRETVQNASIQLPSGNEKGPLQVSAYTRKAAYHFGWDWGPRFVTAGIWRPIKINTWEIARIHEVLVQTNTLNDSLATVQFDIQVQQSQDLNESLKIKIGEQIKTIHSPDSIALVTFHVAVKNPKLWWCNGQGEPHLYTFPIELIHGENRLEVKEQKVGIRTVELINKPDSIGTSFYFKLNGKPIFMKGANYIPQDLFLPRVDTNNYQNLIKKVKELNMNMLRVWGGGIYERDLFYDLCDANGILVWQDFMFAGSMYPTDKNFKANIKEEVKENIIRLRNHPCLALWCGNNEIEVAWHNWGWQKQLGYSPADSTKLWNNYLSLFDTLLPNLVAKHHPNINYTRTSPLSNWGTAENFNHSSMHYWGVWHGQDNFEDYQKNVGRFMVEYGFQSYPSLQTLRKSVHDSSLYMQSPVMKNRQKSYVGNDLIVQQIGKYLDPPNDFSDFIFKSQLVQKIALQQAVTAHLKQQPHCMGTLLWQLNDCWPGPSWSIIDYYGENKMAYDMIRAKFAE